MYEHNARGDVDEISRSTVMALVSCGVSPFPSGIWRASQEKANANRYSYVPER